MKTRQFVNLYPVFLVILVSLFASCETETNATYYIQNNSDSIITVEFNDYFADISTEYVWPNEKRYLKYFSKRGKEFNEMDPTAPFGNLLIVMNYRGDTCKKEVLNVNNWFITMKNNESSADHEYTLTIENEDF